MRLKKLHNYFRKLIFSCRVWGLFSIHIEYVSYPIPTKPVEELTS